MTFLDSSINVNANQIIDQLNQIASPAVKAVFQSYVTHYAIQGQIDMKTGMIWGGVAAVLLILGIVSLVGAALTVDTDARDFFVLAFLIFIALALIAALVGVHNYTNGYAEAANPSYYAIQELLQNLPGK